MVAAGGAGVLILVVVIWVAGVGTGAGGHRGRADPPRAARHPAPPSTLPGGGRQIFPEHRVVAFYGAPGDPRLGVLGDASPTQIALRLKRQAAAYVRPGRPVLPALELITTVATSTPGSDGTYSARQPAAVVARYLAAARRVGALLILDLQPGRSDFLTQARAYAAFLRDPDVSLALDPEWQLTPGEVPEQQIGSTTAAAINRVSAYLAGIVTRARLPQKLLIVHQFTPDMIRQRDLTRPRAGLAITFDIDGFGDPPDKLAKYHALSTSASYYHGFKLFYHQDLHLMTPGRVMRIAPEPSLVVYQ